MFFQTVGLEYLRFTQNGNPVETGILGEKYPLNLYFAYGIRNGFGLDFDPVSGKLWDTENGPQSGDEINLVEPGFNGGWNKIQGMGVGSEFIKLEQSNIRATNGIGRF